MDEKQQYGLEGIKTAKDAFERAQICANRDNYRGALFYIEYAESEIAKDCQASGQSFTDVCERLLNVTAIRFKEFAEITRQYNFA